MGYSRDLNVETYLDFPTLVSVVCPNGDIKQKQERQKTTINLSHFTHSHFLYLIFSFKFGTRYAPAPPAILPTWQKF